MTMQIPPTEPLDEQEREFARIVRALPGGEPPAALDARILRAATNAAAASRRPGARWLASAGAMWGIGGAAAAVLALGVSWQMLNPTHAPMREEAAPAATMSDAAEEDSVSIEFKDKEEREFDNSPPPPPAEMNAAPSFRARANAPRPAAAPPAPPAAPPAPAPEPFAADQLDEHVASSAEGADMSSADVAAEPIVAERQESHGYAAKSATTESQTRAAQPTLGRSDAKQRAGVAGAAAAASAPAPASQALAGARDDSDAAASGPLRKADGLLTAEEWLSHTRRLRDADRRAEAKTSLLEFRRRYPYAAIPTDLAPLLRE